MPNWTSNTLTLTGDAESLKLFLDNYCTDGRLDFDKVIPKPEGFDEDLPSGTGDEAYEVFFKDSSTLFGTSKQEMLIARHEKDGVTSLTELRDFLSEQYAKRRQDTLSRPVPTEQGWAAMHHRNAVEQYNKYPAYIDLAAGYKRNVDLTGHKTWYEWNVANWGTKWNISEMQLNGSPEEGELEMEFSTAWAEPLPVFEQLHKLFPTLLIRYVAEHEGDDNITGRIFYPEDN